MDILQKNVNGHDLACGCAACIRLDRAMLRGRATERPASKYAWGLPVSVYRDAGRNIDCTLGGVSSDHDELLLVGEGVDGPVRVSESNLPVVVLVKRVICGKEYLHVQPEIEGCWCFGGNYVKTSDGRFPNAYPLAIHDRDEHNPGRW